MAASDCTACHSGDHVNATGGHTCRPAQVEEPLSRPVEYGPTDIHGRLAAEPANVVTLTPEVATLLGFVHGAEVDVPTLIARAVDVAKHRDQLKVALQMSKEAEVRLNSAVRERDAARVEAKALRDKVARIQEAVGS